MPKQALLRTGLTINATFSVLCAIILLTFGQQLAELMGEVSTIVLYIIGISLLLFAAQLGSQVAKNRLTTLPALIVSIADIGWVLASIVLLVFTDNLTDFGAIIVALVASVVLLCASLQLCGIHKIHRIKGGSAYRHCVPMAVEASAESLWRIIGDLGAIAQYAPQLASSRVIDGGASDVGAVRCCQGNDGKQWSERCTVYEPEQRLKLSFLCDDPDFPLPVKKMDGGWDLKALGENRCEVRVWWEMELEVKASACVFMPIFSHLMDRDFKHVMRNMAGKVTPAKTKGHTRILPLPC